MLPIAMQANLMCFFYQISNKFKQIDFTNCTNLKKKIIDISHDFFQIPENFAQKLLNQFLWRILKVFTFQVWDQDPSRVARASHGEDVLGHRPKTRWKM